MQQVDALYFTACCKGFACQFQKYKLKRLKRLKVSKVDHAVVEVVMPDRCRVVQPWAQFEQVERIFQW